MTDAWGRDAAQALIGIGFAHEDLVAGDGASRLLATRDVKGVVLRSLGQTEVLAASALASHYADVQVKTDRLVEVDFSQPNAAGKLQTLNPNAYYRLHAYFDKQSWAEAELPDWQATWFLTAEAAVTALSGELHRLSDWLIPDPDRPFLFLVSEVDLDLSGPFLEAKGGAFLGSQPAMTTPTEDAVRISHRMRHHARTAARWSGLPDLKLTPAHLWCDGEGWDTDVGKHILSHLVSLALMYTCDRAYPAEDRGLRVEFSGRDRVVALEVSTGELQHFGSPQETVDTIRGLLRWCYDEEPADANRSWIAERLQLVQISVVDLLYAVEPRRRVASLIAGLPELTLNSRSSWKAFLAGSLSEHARERASFISAVDDTIQELATRSGDISKAVIDAMLAAVAVTVGLFVASALQEAFNAELFAIGLYIYAGYVLLFPAAFGLLSQLGRFRATTDAYARHRRNFEVIMGRDLTEELEGNTIERAQARFWWSFVAASLAYSGVVVAAILAARVVPPLLELG